MTEYTTAEVMHEVLWSKVDEVKPEYQRAFEKWLAEVERAAAEKAWDEGVMKIYANASVDLDPKVRPLENPYRRNEGESE